MFACRTGRGLSAEASTIRWREGLAGGHPELVPIPIRSWAPGGGERLRSQSGAFLRFSFVTTEDQPGSRDLRPVGGRDTAKTYRAAAFSRGLRRKRQLAPLLGSRSSRPTLPPRPARKLFPELCPEGCAACVACDARVACKLPPFRAPEKAGTWTHQGEALEDVGR